MTKTFKLLPKTLKYLLYISIVIILIIEFIGYSFPEIFKGAYIISKIVLELSYAYLASLIFYYFVIHINNISEKKSIYNYLLITINEFIEDYEEIKKEILKSDSEKDIDFDDLENVKSILTKKEFDNDLLFIEKNVKFGNFSDYLINKNYITKERVNEIFLNSHFLETDLIIILNKLKWNKFLTNISLNRKNTLNHLLYLNLSDFSGEYIEYHEIISELIRYKNTEIKKLID